MVALVLICQTAWAQWPATEAYTKSLESENALLRAVYKLDTTYRNGTIMAGRIALDSANRDRLRLAGFYNRGEVRRAELAFRNETLGASLDECNSLLGSQTTRSDSLQHRLNAHEPKTWFGRQRKKATSVATVAGFMTIIYGIDRIVSFFIPH